MEKIGVFTSMGIWHKQQAHTPFSHLLPHFPFPSPLESLFSKACLFLTTVRTNSEGFMAAHAKLDCSYLVLGCRSLNKRSPQVMKP